MVQRKQFNKNNALETKKMTQKGSVLGPLGKAGNTIFLKHSYCYHLKMNTRKCQHKVGELAGLECKPHLMCI